VTTSIVPPKPHKPWSRRKDYLLAGIRQDEYGVRAGCGDARTDRRKMRAVGKREVQRMVHEALAQ
jgi:hypothetical protein